MNKLLVTAMVGVAFLASSLYATVYAEVNGKKITDEEIAVILRAMPGKRFDQLPADMQKKVLDQAIDRVLLTSYAKKEGVQKSEEYKEGLVKLKDDLALEVWMKQKFDATQVPNSELKSFYNKNKDKFKQPERVLASHILVKTKAEADKIIDELEDTSSSKLKDRFASLAAKDSVDKASARNGGSLGWFDKNQMVPDFTKVAFSLKPGEFTKEPVKTQFGYHIIMVDDKKAPSTISFEQAKRGIDQQLKADEFKEDVQDIAQSLRKKAKIKYEN